MMETLPILLRLAGAGLILLALLHVPIGRHLKWREDGAHLTPVNAEIFRVHTLFICIVLVLMGLPCLFDPGVLLERSRGGAWLAWSWAGFWFIRLLVQWLVFPTALWRGKRMETILHCAFTVLWTALAVLFTACGLWQAEWFHQ